jgi:hypothetical protein
MRELSTPSPPHDQASQPGQSDPPSEQVPAETPAAALARLAFATTLDGRMPRLADLATATGNSADDVERLIGRRLMIDESGRVVATHGLSLVPARQHRLNIRGRQFWTWCAIDVIGIPAGLAEDAIAETTCLHCGTPVDIDFRAGEIATPAILPPSCGTHSASRDLARQDRRIAHS